MLGLCLVDDRPCLPGLLCEGCRGLEGAGNVALLGSPCLVVLPAMPWVTCEDCACFPKCEKCHSGVVLFECFVDAFVFQLSEAVILVDLDDCYGARELVCGPHFLNEEVRNGDGLCSSCDAYAPLSGL